MIGQEIVSFVLVLVVAVGVAGAVSALYATGLRFWSASEESAAAGDGYLVRRAISCVCFVACVVIILFALWLMIPIFH